MTEKAHQATIIYREFYDVPRMFIVRYKNAHFLFHCEFDEPTDEFRDNYKVYLMPALAESVVCGSWRDLPSKAIRVLGEIPVDQINFDQSKRRKIDVQAIENLLGASGLSGISLGKLS